MPRSSTTWKPGQSGNPKGRPQTKRALTSILESTGNKKLHGLTVTAKRALAQRVWEAVTTGQVIFGRDGEGVGENKDKVRILTLNVDQWIDTVKFLYGQIDGPPKMQAEISGPDGGPITTKTTATVTVYLPDNGRGDRDTD